MTDFQTTKVSQLPLRDLAEGYRALAVDSNGDSVAMDMDNVVDAIAKADAASNKVDNLTTSDIEGLSDELALKTDKTYVDDELASVDHNLTTNRTAANAHPISAITNLQPTLDAKADITYVDAAVSYDQWYGYEYDKTVSAAEVTRIGRLDLHRSLPIQNKMRGCLIDNTTGEVKNYLNNWNDYPLDGSAGQVMVEIPEFYIRPEVDGNIVRTKFSAFQLPNYIKVPKMHIGAFEATVNRDDNTLCSVVNASAKYRGGNNNADWDDTYRSLLGRPATSISRTDFTTYARNRGTTTEWNGYLYLAHRMLYQLFVLEYGTRNSQAPYTAELDSNGFKQGGLGDGVTTVDNTTWGEKFSYYPFVPCGVTNSLGNGTGEVDYTSVDENNDELWTVKVNRYRGIELPFGHIWKWADGINVDVKTDVDGGTSEVYVCKDPAKFSDSSNVDYELRGLESRSNGYIKEIIGGDNGDIIPTEIGGGSSTYFCDYHYASITSSSLRGVRFGGYASGGKASGFACSRSNDTPSSALATIGSRLCFKPKN